MFRLLMWHLCSGSVSSRLTHFYYLRYGVCHNSERWDSYQLVGVQLNWTKFVDRVLVDSEVCSYGTTSFLNNIWYFILTAPPRWKYGFRLIVAFFGIFHCDATSLPDGKAGRSSLTNPLFTALYACCIVLSSSRLFLCTDQAGRATSLSIATNL